MTDALLLCILPRGLIQRDSQHLGLYQCVQRGVALTENIDTDNLAPSVGAFLRDLLCDITRVWVKICGQTFRRVEPQERVDIRFECYLYPVLVNENFFNITSRSARLSESFSMMSLKMSMAVLAVRFIRTVALCFSAIS